MAASLPYMTSPGSIPKILQKICEATVPESFNGDFLGTRLGFPGGNQKSFISWAKKCGLLNTDGTPTQIYKNFRNPSYRGVAMAEALKTGYTELYIRNEYAHDLSRAEFTKLVSEIIGSAHDSGTVKLIVSSFFFAKDFADFEANSKNTILPQIEEKKLDKEQITSNSQTHKKLNLGLNYTINLVLPKTDDPAIYGAIFKSLKENLLDE